MWIPSENGTKSIVYDFSGAKISRKGYERNSDDYEHVQAAAWVMLPNGHVVITGGVTSVYFDTTVDILPETGVIKMLEPMNHERCGHAMCYYKDSLYVFGGFKNGGLVSAEQFTNQIWKKLPDMESEKQKAGCCVANGKIYIAGFGSDQIDVLDPVR